MPNTGGCGLLVKVTAGYYDLDGDFPAGMPEAGVRVLPVEGTSADPPLAADPNPAGSDGSAGVVAFDVCLAAETTGELRYYLRDESGNFGNTACFSVEAPAGP